MTDTKNKTKKRKAIKKIIVYISKYKKWYMSFGVCAIANVLRENVPTRKDEFVVSLCHRNTLEEILDQIAHIVKIYGDSPDPWRFDIDRILVEAI
ncbi:MAG: hypothetical protein DRJ03_07445 [Chloroflexi bacterium]|nr:MAG: hypothetical protein DRJ03_07445 [Chloroflexota bacterium]